MSRFNTSFALCISALVLAVGCAGETKTDSDTAAAATGSDTAAASAPKGDPMAPSASTMLDPNAASQAELVAVGVSDSVAAALIAGRPYADMLAVDKVLAKHLTEPRRDSMYARLWLPINLNSATAEEILLIPGVGPRMRREFEEYRPYTSIAQFRRDIGKYVDKDELARLEKYVATP